jgi:DNA methylase
MSGPPMHRAGTSAIWRSRIVGHASLPPNKLLAHPDNWRRHPAAQRRAIRASLTDVGWVQGVVVSRRSGRILDGHGRVEDAIAHGEPEVPVTYVDLDETEERLVLATFDPIGSLAEPDPDALASLLGRLGPIDGELGVLLEGLASMAVAPATVDLDEVPDRPDDAATYVRRGQLWLLGRHRVLCGDALDPIAVARLLAGDRPRLLVTDPPFGVHLDLARRHAGAGAKGDGARGLAHRRVSLAGDERTDWSGAFELVPSLSVGYVWHPAIHVTVVVAGLERIGFELVSEIIWAKTRWAVGPRWYHWAHESCLVVRRHGSRLRFLGGRDQGTVWEAPSPKVGGAGADPKVDHPSQKPVVLFERPIRNHLPPGGLVYDPFLGSGTALIAADRSGRRCIGMDIDPAVVQVAIERWQRLTGTRAQLAGEVSA